MFHPVSAGPARNHDAGRKAVPVRRRLPVHLICDQRRFIERLPQGNTLDEVGGLVAGATVGAVQDDFDRLSLQADRVEQILEPNALPSRTAHGAIAPFDAYDMRLHQAAAVTGALTDRNHFGRWQLLQIVEAKPGLTVSAIAADGQLPSF